MPNRTVEPAGDPETIVTARIQEAIDAVHAAGGGRVALLAGSTYRSGTIELRPGIEFHLEHASRLEASADPADYRDVGIAGEYGGNAGGFLIQANDADDIALTGTGTIDGRALEFMDGWWSEDGPYIRAPKGWRPRGVGFFGCRGVRIQELTIRDAAQWTIHLTGCENVLVHGITIKNRLDVPNCDGIDPDHCRNVRIIGCHIEAGDDGIVCKNTKDFVDYGPCENIVIAGCTIVSTSAAIKLGTESRGDFRDIAVSDCVIRHSHRGLAIQLRDQGTIENVSFSNCIVETRLFHTRWWGSAEPIYVTSFPRHDGDPPGKIRNVRFRNIDCRGEGGVFLAATSEAPLEDVVLDGVRVRVRDTSRWPGGRFDCRPRHSEEHSGLERRPTACVYAEHVDGLRLCDVDAAFDGDADWFGRVFDQFEVTGLEGDVRGRA